MKALFTSFPAAEYAASKDFYENVLRLTVVQEFEGGPHRATNYDLGGPVLKIFEWTEKWHGSGHSGLFIETDKLDEVFGWVRQSSGKACESVVQPWSALPS